MSRVPQKKRSALKKKAWELLSMLMRKERKFCERCGSPDNLQVHHIIPKARGNAVYFLRDNLLVLCRGCHFWWHTKASPEEEQELIDKVIGSERWAEVEAIKNTRLEIKPHDLEELIKTYKAQLEAL